MPTLVLENGKQAGTVIVVTAGLVMGLRLELPFTLDDPKASREHAKISAHGEGFVMVDLKSTNGTFLNGNRVQQARLNDGDRIRIGQTEMTFRESNGEAPEPAPVEEVSEPPVDIEIPSPKKLKIASPPPKRVSITLKPKRRGPRRKK